MAEFIRFFFKRKKIRRVQTSDQRIILHNTPMRLLRGLYGCAGCRAKTTEWCKADCDYMDPFDYRKELRKNG